MVYDIVTDELKLINRCMEIDPQKESPLLRKIVSGLKDTIKEKGLTSLSAPEIGFDKRVFVIKYGENQLVAYINPIVSKAVGLDFQKESCPAIPDKVFLLPRNTEVDVMYMTPLGDIKSQHLVGLAARTFLHCNEHLEGVLISDIGLEIDDEFDKATEEERLELIKAYADSLDIMLKQTLDEIEADPELKQISDGIKFTESVRKGETKIKAVTIDEADQEKMVERNLAYADAKNKGEIE